MGLLNHKRSQWQLLLIVHGDYLMPIARPKVKRFFPYFKIDNLLPPPPFGNVLHIYMKKGEINRRGLELEESITFPHWISYSTKLAAFSTCYQTGLSARIYYEVVVPMWWLWETWPVARVGFRPSNCSVDLGWKCLLSVLGVRGLGLVFTVDRSFWVEIEQTNI